MLASTSDTTTVVLSFWTLRDRIVGRGCGFPAAGLFPVWCQSLRSAGADPGRSFRTAARLAGFVATRATCSFHRPHERSASGVTLKTSPCRLKGSLIEQRVRTIVGQCNNLSIEVRKSPPVAQSVVHNHLNRIPPGIVVRPAELALCM